MELTSDKRPGSMSLNELLIKFRLASDIESLAMGPRKGKRTGEVAGLDSEVQISKNKEPSKKVP